MYNPERSSGRGARRFRRGFPIPVWGRVLLALLPVLFPAAAASAPEADGPGRPAWPLLLDLREEGSDRRFSLSLNDMRVGEALRFCLQGTGLQLVEEDTLAMPARGSLDSVTVAEALDNLLRAYDLSWNVAGSQLIVGRHEEATFTVAYLADPESPFWKELEVNLRSLLSGEGKLVLHPRSGTVHVIDRPSAVSRLGRFLQSIERDLGRQVNIESKLVEVGLNNQEEVGIDWTAFAKGWDGWSGNTRSGGLLELATASGQGVFQMGLIRTGRLELLLDLLEARGNVRVLSRPRVAAMGNEPALFRSTENIPYYVQDVFTSQGSSPYIQYRVEFQQAGVVLEVMAHAGPDGNMTLKVHPSVSSLTGFTAALPNLPPQPIVDQRETRTTVRMREGETLVIGGLIHEREEHSTRGIPVLSRIPWLGHLFRRTATETKKQELVIFLTPRILADGLAELQDDRSRCLRFDRPFPAFDARAHLAAREHARGVEAFLSRELREAIRSARRAASLAPDRPELRFNLGLYLAAAGQLDEAEETWSVLARLPDLAPLARSNLQALALWRGTAPADTIPRWVLPGSPEPVLVAAQALNESSRLIGLGRGIEARAVLEKGVTFLPRQAEPLRLLLQGAVGNSP
jgi:hypothetical protein